MENLDTHPRRKRTEEMQQKRVRRTEREREEKTRKKYTRESMDLRQVCKKVGRGWLTERLLGEEKGKKK